jgi:hypothetical protein
MSKILENEYKQLAQNNAPDLWDRIEAGINEKSSLISAAPAQKVVHFRKYTGLIAAGLGVAIIVPAVIAIRNIDRSNGYSAGTGWAADQAAMPEYNMDAPAEEAGSDYAPEAAEAPQAAPDRPENESAMPAETGVTEAAEQPERAMNDNSGKIQENGGVSPLADLMGKTSADLSLNEIELLLDTPVAELHQYFGIAPEDIREWMMGSTAITPIRSVEFLYDGSLDGNFDGSPDGNLDRNVDGSLDEKTDGDDQSPTYLAGIYLWYDGKTGGEIPLGYTLDEILAMPEWGQTEVNEFKYAGGYSGEGASFLKELNYTKNGLRFSFRMDYANVFAPEGEQELTAALVVVTKV